MTNLLAKINISNENDYLQVISSSLELGQKKILFYLNSHILYEANRDNELKDIVLQSDYLVADGYSIVLASKKILKKEIKKVVFTYSYFKFLRDYFIQNGISVFFLGASVNNIEKAVKSEKVNFPELLISGYHNGYFDKKNENEKIISLINKSNAQVLIVGMGCPIAEKWIYENMNKLSPTLIFSVGGFFDFLAEDKKIAPKWMYNSGFEWLHRLVHEPKRLFIRYLFANSWLVFYVTKTKLKNVFK